MAESPFVSFFPGILILTMACDCTERPYHATGTYSMKEHRVTGG